MGVLIARWRAVKSNNYMVEVDPLIESLYRWSDISGVLLMGIIGGTMARKRGYETHAFDVDVTEAWYESLRGADGVGIIRGIVGNIDGTPVDLGGGLRAV